MWFEHTKRIAPTHQDEAYRRPSSRVHGSNRPARALRRATTICAVAAVAAASWLGCESDPLTAEAGGAPPSYGGYLTSFVDASAQHWAYRPIEGLYQEGYVAGCDDTPRAYCPEETLTRAEAAVFVVRGRRGAGYIPPDTLPQPFADVPVDSWASKWIARLWYDGFTAGCGLDQYYHLLYCPWRDLNRAEGFVFFLRMLNSPGFEPPDARGLFSNLQRDWWGTRWIEAAFDARLIPEHMLQLTSHGLLFIGAEDPMTRAEAAYSMYKATPQADFDVRTGPTNLEITDWNHWSRWCSDHPDPDNCDSRHERAKQVKRWMVRYEGDRYWPGVFPQEQYLVSALLYKEGGTLCCHDENLPRMAGGIRARLLAGFAPESLAHFVAFYDPIAPGSGNFDSSDWQLITRLLDGQQVIDLPYYLDHVRQAYVGPLDPADAFRYWWGIEEMTQKYKANPSKLSELCRSSVEGPGCFVKTARADGSFFYFTRFARVFFCALGQSPQSWGCP